MADLSTASARLRSPSTARSWPIWLCANRLLSKRWSSRPRKPSPIWAKSKRPLTSAFPLKSKQTRISLHLRPKFKALRRPLGWRGAFSFATASPTIPIPEKTMSTDLADLKSSLHAAIAGAKDEAALDAVRVSALGKKGSISALLATLGQMSPDERKLKGPEINGLKAEIAATIESRRSALAASALDARLAGEKLDVTLPLRPAPTASGRIHPVSQVIDEITAIFSDMGFAIAEGPDI